MTVILIRASLEPDYKSVNLFGELIMFPAIESGNDQCHLIGDYTNDRKIL